MKTIKLPRWSVLLFTVIGFVAVSSCSNDEPKLNSLMSISEYAAANNLNPTYTASGLGLVINDAGSDRKPIATSTVRVAYTGMLTNREVFAQSEGTYVNLSSTNLIECWKEGMQEFGEGGSGIILSPTNLAFGSSGAEGVPGGADVIFDIELATVLFNVDEYLANQNITPTGTTTSGTKVLIETEGDDNYPSISDVVQIKYRGYFTDGQEFDTSGDDFISLSLGNVIKGWREGLTLFSKGAKGKLFIPFDSAYGVEGFNTIPGRTDLIFDIELQDFN